MSYLFDMLTFCAGKMGAVFGRQTQEALAYQLLRDAPAYEVRMYDQHPIIEVRKDLKVADRRYVKSAFRLKQKASFL